MNIGILQAGHVPDELAPLHGSYAGLFERFLGQQGLQSQAFAVVDGVFPTSVTQADGWLITGSRHGAYEDHPMIAPLEAFIRESYAQAVPLVGICFGHQIMAQALGGRVVQHPDGWCIGLQSYQEMDPERDPEDEQGQQEAPGLALNAFHQDQVVALPPDAEILATSPSCRIAALSYGKRALSYQAHPEFSTQYLRDLIHARAALLPDAQREAALKQLAQAPPEAPDAELIGERIATFFRARQMKAH